MQGKNREKETKKKKSSIFSPIDFMQSDSYRAIESQMFLVCYRTIGISSEAKCPSLRIEMRQYKSKVEAKEQTIKACYVLHRQNKFNRQYNM
jgi:hypothetical protein